ncbi:hypothetical protein DMA11_05155 [Marinilabiliaceae bacterium JC017]|nr:hypothetical protein DMA11_05155 [Marinilabiliaceae bacterium JC017]
MKKNQITLAILFTFLSFFSAFSQETEKKSFKERLYTGGNIGLSFGSYTNILISPIIGLKLTPKLYSGIGFEYNYTKDKIYNTERTYNQYGGRAFLQYNIIPQLFAHSEFSGMSLERYVTNETKTRDFVPFLYLGGGYRQMLSPRSFMTFRVLFDVLQHKNSPYTSWEPLLSIGFGVEI